MESVTVRMILKSQADNNCFLATASPPSISQQTSMTQRQRAEHAFRVFLNLGISLNQAIITNTNAIQAQLPLEQFKQIFKAELIEKSKQVSPFSSPQKYLSPKGELKVPKALQNCMAFAYLPTPPTYFNALFEQPSFTPPPSNLHHFRVEDIVRLLNVAKCHRSGWTGQNIQVILTDSGFAAHPYFDSQGYDIDTYTHWMLYDPQKDLEGHGTGVSANLLAIAPNCQFRGISVLQSNSTNKQCNLPYALEFALRKKPHIISNSWGRIWDKKKYPNMTMKKLKNLVETKKITSNTLKEFVDLDIVINQGIQDGVTFVFAGGNGPECYAFPASHPDVIAVGGVYVGEDGQKEASNFASSFTSNLYPNRNVPDFCGIVGNEEDHDNLLKGHIMLPTPRYSNYEGKSLPLKYQNKGWGIFSGTSSAAPQIAGIIALMLSINPNLSTEEIREILSNTSSNNSDNTEDHIVGGKTAMGVEPHVGKNLAIGAGLVNGFKACQKAAQLLK